MALKGHESAASTSSGSSGSNDSQVVSVLDDIVLTGDLTDRHVQMRRKS